ncbi:MAG: hypothetical protein GF393_09295 [Armatimonadia bacterium]|nr:hypothetical protein [Armatimonadia bacterium]
MRRDELIEQIIMIAVLVGFLYHIFTGYDPRWFHVLLYYVSPVALAVIFVRRYRRMQEGFEYSRKIVDAQHQATGANVVGRDPQQPQGPQSPYPGVVLPDQGAEGVEMGGSDDQAPPDFGGIPGISGQRPDDDQ